MLKSASGLDSWQAEQCFVVIESPRSSEEEQLTFNQRVGMSEFPGGTTERSLIGRADRVSWSRPTAHPDSFVPSPPNLFGPADTASPPAAERQLVRPRHVPEAARGHRVKPYRPPFAGR